MGICFSHSTAMELLRRRKTRPTRHATWTPNSQSSARFSPSANEIEALLDDPDFAYLSRPMHILVPDASSRILHRGNLVACHVCSKQLPRDSLITLDDRRYSATPELCLAQLATVLPFATLLAQACELCGVYRIDPTLSRGFADASPLTSAPKIKSFIESADYMQGSKSMLRALPYLFEGSASPKETALALILCLSPRFGGYGLPMPQMNRQIDAGARARRATSKGSYRCDLCWPQTNLAVEYDSNRDHTGPYRISRDSSRRNSLSHLGFNVITVTNNQMVDAFEMDRIAQIVAKALGVRLRTRKSNWREVQLELFLMLENYYRAP